MSENRDVFQRLTDLLVSGAASYRTMVHEPEGQTEAASRLRQHPLAQAAKSIVVRVATGKRSRRYVLAVVPGDRRVDLSALSVRYGGREASFATPEVAERLAGSVSGSITPFAFSSELDLLVDEGLIVHDEIYFNAGRLDVSFALSVADYLKLARPVIAAISV
jgi:Ala-tRNA(Pro) deacylase